MNMDFNISLRPADLPPPAAAEGGAPASAGADALLSGAGVTLAAARPADPEGVDAAVEAALVRDDDLGRLMAAAFNLPAPPPPAFGDASA